LVQFQTYDFGVRCHRRWSCTDIIIPCADNITRARELLAAARPKGQPTAAAVDPNKASCPSCGGRMIIIEVFERGATPRHQLPTKRIRDAGLRVRRIDFIGPASATLHRD